MWSYLKAAFWARPEIPSLGRVPLNALFLSGFGLLGLGHPGFWMAGVALETAYLYALSTNARFQNLVDAENTQIEEQTVEEKRLALVQSLIPSRRQQLADLEQKCDRILQMHRDAQSDEFIIAGDAEAVEKIQWLYLKLLVAQQNIASLQAPSADLKQQIERLENDLRSGKRSSNLQESKTATLQILQQRLANLDRREQTLEEIASDLTRIEAQVELAVENTGLRGRNESISANIDLVSQLLDDSVYGESGASIAALEQTYGEKA